MDILTDQAALTPAQLFREIASLEKLMDQRMTANELAVSVAHADLVRVPTAVDKAIATLKDLVFAHMDEKFKNVDDQFDLRDVRHKDYAEARKESVADALRAAAEAVAAQNASFSQTIAKSEANTIKLIDAMGDKITALTDRMNLDSGRHSGVTAGIGYIIAGVGLIATFLGAVATFIVLKNEPNISTAMSYPVSSTAPAQPAPPPTIVVMPFQSLPPATVPAKP